METEAGSLLLKNERKVDKTTTTTTPQSGTSPGVCSMFSGTTERRARESQGLLFLLSRWDTRKQCLNCKWNWTWQQPPPNGSLSPPLPDDIQHIMTAWCSSVIHNQ